MRLENLALAIAEKRTILFVGAGISTSLGLPTFPGLIKHIGEELGYDPELYSTLGDVYQLTEFYMTQKGSLGSLRSWMDVEWHKSGIDISKSMIHRLIVNLQFPIIYTTNYDRWLERSYENAKKEYLKIVQVADFAKVKDGVTQIIKFHGDFDHDASIVLTESSYFDRLSFESPLDIRLRSDALGKSILFLGYSLSDINLRYLIYRLVQQWEAAARSMSVDKQLRPSCYMFMTRPNAVSEAVLASRGITPLVSNCNSASEGTEQFLTELLENVQALGGNINY